MQSFFFILVLLFAFACKHHKSNISLTNPPEKDLKIPNGIFLDTLSIYDSSLNLEISIILPKAKDESLLFINRILDTLYIMQKDFTADIKKTLQEDSLAKEKYQSWFLVSPLQLYKEGNILSYSLGIEINQPRAIHTWHGIHSFNFDTEKQKEIKFSDFFFIPSAQDSVIFLKMVNEYFNNEQVHADKLYAFDFNLLNDSIWFNFDNYEISSYVTGTPSAIFHAKELAQYINKEYSNKLSGR